MKQFSFLMFIITINFCKSFSQNIVKDVDFNLSWSSSFVKAIESRNSNFYISCSKLDSSIESVDEYPYTTLIKLDPNGNLIWDKECFKYSSNHLLFEDDSNHIISIDNYFKARAFLFIGDFYLTCSKFDTNGHSVLKYVDTISIQSHRINNIGTLSRYNDDKLIIAVDYFNPIDSVLGLIIKKYNIDGTFINEDSTTIFKRTNLLNRIEVKNIFLNQDSTFAVIVDIKGKLTSDSSYIGIIMLNKNFKAISYSLSEPLANFTNYFSIMYQYNNIIILGSQVSTDLKSINNLIIKYNIKSAGFSKISLDKYNNICFTSIKESNGGNFFLSGYKKDLINKKSAFALCKLNENFEIKWDFVWNENESTKTINQIIIHENEKRIFIFGTREYKSYFGILDLTTDVSDDLELKQKLFLTPNPVSDILLIKSEHKYDLIEIYSSLGIKVAQVERIDKIDVSALAPGLYFLKVGDRISKFIKI